MSAESQGTPAKSRVYSLQIKPLVYELVDENCVICDADGNHVVHPIQFVGHAEESEWPVWVKDAK